MSIKIKRSFASRAGQRGSNDRQAGKSMRYLEMYLDTLCLRFAKRVPVAYRRIASQKIRCKATRRSHQRFEL